jgi:hypothetical protein
VSVGRCEGSYFNTLGLRIHCGGNVPEHIWRLFDTPDIVADRHFGFESSERVPARKTSMSLDGQRQKSIRWLAWSGREPVAKHRQALHGLRLGCFVLKDVPVPGELAVFEADDVGSNPRGGHAVSREVAMCNDILPFCHGQLVLVVQGVGKGADQVGNNWQTHPAVFSHISPGC